LPFGEEHYLAIIRGAEFTIVTLIGR
jgi:hypothetical protein